MDAVKLVASMIVRNELDRYLEPALVHLLSYCDEIRVLDDGSTDDWNTRVFDSRIKVKRLERSKFYAHEGRARQRLLEWTMEGEPTHVLAIDADEFVENPLALRSVIDDGFDVIRLCMMEVWKATETFLSFRMDGGWKPHEAPLVYRVPAGSRWQIPQRQLASGRIPNEVIGQRRNARSAGVGIYHFGWACAADRAARHQRYVDHDSGKFHASSHLDSILWADADPRLVLCHDPWPKGLDAQKSAILVRSNRV